MAPQSLATPLHRRQLFNIPIASGIDSTDETDVLLTIAFVSHKLYNAENDNDDAQYGK